MKSLLNKKQLPGFLAVGLVSLAVGAAGAPASAAPSATSSGATVSGLTKKQSKAKKKALKKCNRKRPAKKKKACKKAVNKRYKKIAKRNSKPTTPPIGKTVTVDLGDNYFAPDPVNLKVNDAINWSWANIGGYEPHNVTLDNGPAGVARTDFLSQTSAVPSYRFKRQFTKAGTYNFVCSLHVGMTLTVNVSK